jgi:hypothetical protein
MRNLLTMSRSLKITLLILAGIIKLLSSQQHDLSIRSSKEKIRISGITIHTGWSFSLSQRPPSEEITLPDSIRQEA